MPDHFVVVNGLRISMPIEINLTFEEPATTAENRVVADVTQVVSQVVDAVQSTVAIPAGKSRNHLAGEWMDEARNTWLVGIK